MKRPTRALVGGPGPDPFTALCMAFVTLAIVGALINLSLWCARQ